MYIQKHLLWLWLLVSTTLLGFAAASRSNFQKEFDCAEIQSPSNVLVGESFFVNVQFDTECHDVRIAIDGVNGAQQYRQFRGAPGLRHLFISATGSEKQTAFRKVPIMVHEVPCKDRPFPLVEATESRYQPRTVSFRIGNGNHTDLLGATYEWDFGDGTVGITEALDAVEHDYTRSLQRDTLTTEFHLTVTAKHLDYSIQLVKRTVSVFNLYAYNKRNKILTPQATIVQIPLPLVPVLEYIVEITNPEDEPMIFTTQRIELLDSNLDFVNRFLPATNIGLVVPPGGTVATSISFPRSTFKKNTFGFGVHFNGTGQTSGTSAVTSAYKKVVSPLRFGGVISKPTLQAALDRIFRLSPSMQKSISHADIQFILGQSLFAAKPNFTLPDTTQSNRTSFGNIYEIPKAFDFRPRPLGDFHPSLIADLINGTVRVLSNGFDEPVVGDECDPDNIPDTVPDGFACQFTGETAWRFSPGMIVNARKGDVLLSPGGNGKIGQLLKHVNPPQLYSHSGIMTKNFIEVRHSTGSEDWLGDHLVGYKGTNGFDDKALKYVWPGTITQTIDHSTYGEIVAAENGKTYSVSSFSFHPNRGDTNTLVSPLVVKPPPILETRDIRLKLHQIADAALGIQGHYRFYGYTRPEFALEPAGTAPADAGWAAGTVGTVCSSFIWLAAQKAGVRLEGANSRESASDLETMDVLRGGDVAASGTLDGLYRYTASERQSAAHWLFNNIHDEVESKEGFWGGLFFPNAADQIGNQLVNTFAFDKSSDRKSDAWKNTPDANAVSPDNILNWDSPGPGNRDDFRGVYGFAEDLHYSPGDFVLQQVFRWTQVPTTGDITGTVVAADGSVEGARVSLRGSTQSDIVVGADGKFSFSGVAEGDYSITAGKDIGGFWESDTQNVHVTAGSTANAILTLKPPPAIHRQITITVHMDVTDVGAWGCRADHCPTSFDMVKDVWLHPFHSSDSVDFVGDIPGTGINGRIVFSLNLEPDLSVKVSWTAQERDGSDVNADVGRSIVVGRDAGISWVGIKVRQNTFWGYDQTLMNWSIQNKQATT